MKGWLYRLVVLLLFSICLNGCANKADEQHGTAAGTGETAVSSEAGISSEAEVSSEPEESEKPAEPTEPVKGEPVEILPLDEQEVKDVLNGFVNFKASDSIYINVPERTSVYDYTFITPDIEGEDIKFYDKAYREMFAYLFPGHEINEEYLLYSGGSSALGYDEEGNFRDYNKVRDWYDEIISGKEGRLHFIYDETWYRDMTEWKNPVCLELPNPMGYGYAVWNKGKTVEITNAMIYNEELKTETYRRLYSYEPEDELEYIGTYRPESTVSFPLLDKEVPICEAVYFFEQYINSLPYPKESNVETCVVEVDVLKVNEDTYGYYFMTTKSYEEVPFDHMRSGTQQMSYDDYIAAGGYAFMVESSDVDVLYSYYRRQGMESVTPYTEVVSFENAAKTVSEKLTKGVEFEVEKVEFVYTQLPKRTAMGYIDVDNYSCEIEPAWKFVLFNPNDDMAYVCYVDAGDETGFRFYKTPNGEKRVQQ